VLIPIKAFAAAKLRLTERLDNAQRAALAREMAGRVLRAAAGLPVSVVCDDDEVATFAVARGASVLWTPGLGLNGAVSEGVARLADAGVEAVVVAHADLPLASDLRPLIGFAGVTVVPDRHDDGTNVLCVPAAAGFVFHYGPASSAHHVEEARRLGLACRVIRDQRLGWDVDVPADLELPLLAGDPPDRVPLVAPIP
jgi:2-phospho-L-lactate guanylyltransferase